MTADGEVAKPEKITVMVDSTVFDRQNGRDEFEARWEELTGIDLEFIQPDHSAYYDVVGQTCAVRKKELAGCDYSEFHLLQRIRRGGRSLGYERNLGEL